MSESSTLDSDPIEHAGQPAWRTSAALVVVAVVAGLPLFLNGSVPSTWDAAVVRYEVPRLAIVRDHQWPLWNPYIDGGEPLLAQPECPTASVWFLIAIAFGTSIGLKIQVVLFAIIGATGIATLLRRLGVSSVGPFVGGVVFALCPCVVSRIADGELQWSAMSLMPWVVVCLSKSETDRRWCVAAAMILASAMTFGSGGVVAGFLPVLTVWTISESVRRKSPWQVIGWCVILLLAVSLSAAKFLPEREFLTAQVGESSFAEIPFLSGMAVSAGFLSVGVFAVAVLAGIGLSWLVDRLQKTDRGVPARICRIVLPSLIAGGLIAFCWSEFRRVSATELTGSPIPIGGEHPGEVSLESGDPTVSIAKWSMSRLKIQLNALGEDRLFLNQRGDTGWTAMVVNNDVGRYEMASGHTSGRVSVKLTAGDREITLRYIPDSFVWGTCISVIALIVCIASVLAETRKRRKHGTGH